ncbi:DEAD/DEAH box helicase [Candidatus Desulfofervidus auxilii]|uniref:RNA helicase n=1 Tax=Desulfofervidus auxilii TaxID=1621989 RepID=A0A7U4QJD2_DESA2|nr:DEAD/DEAH box helicase [Candidatus Desulfofervidus auxilii]AMM40448.1 DEAD/DEAH box helicase [Candidatus Desulfofervidus auxilii]
MRSLDKFKILGLSDNTLKALREKGFEVPTPIQEKIIPMLLKEEMDIVGQAQTGTGKTAAFGLPLIEKIKERTKTVQVIILTPTRELAIQISEEINSFKGNKKLQIVPIYGGQSIEQQLKKLREGVDIVVGTPGRVIDHIHRKSLKLGDISYFILDEADEMLNMGFIEDIEKILKNTNPEKRMLLFGATMPPEILSLAEKYMREYQFIGIKKEQLTPDLTAQIYFEIASSDKLEALCRIIDMEKEFYGLIFCKTKIEADHIATRLIHRGYNAEALHGDRSQYQRERILNKFKYHRVNILVATDVAARGIDIANLTHVINYSLPQDPESYVHRIGRTGRAGKEGTAITFVEPEEYRKLIYIIKMAKTHIKKQKLPEIKDIINIKISRIKAELTHILKSKNYHEYIKIAQELLEENEAEDVLAALLKYSFQDELEKKSYNKIKEVSIDKKGKARLFVALGKIDGMTPKKLVAFIKQQTEVNERKIEEIKVFDKFSFITVPFKEAEVILSIFKRNKKGKRPIIEEAKEKKIACS